MYTIKSKHIEYVRDSAQQISEQLGPEGPGLFVVEDFSNSEESRSVLEEVTAYADGRLAQPSPIIRPNGDVSEQNYLGFSHPLALGKTPMGFGTVSMISNVRSMVRAFEMAICMGNATWTPNTMLANFYGRYIGDGRPGVQPHRNKKGELLFVANSCIDGGGETGIVDETGKVICKLATPINSLVIMRAEGFLEWFLDEDERNEVEEPLESRPIHFVNPGPGGQRTNISLRQIV